MMAVTFCAFGGTFMGTERRKPKISQAFARWLFVCLFIAFAAAIFFIYVLQTHISEQDTDSVLRLNIADVRAAIVEASDKNLIYLSRRIADEIERLDGPAELSDITPLIEAYDVDEINIVDKNGIIVQSTYPDFINYDMASGAQSSEFLVLLRGKTEFSQKYGPVSFDSSISRKYAGVALPSGGFVQVGYGAARFQRDIAEQVISVAHNRHVGENGAIILCDENWTIVSDRMGQSGQKLSATGLTIDTDAVAQGERFVAEVYGKPSYCMYMMSEGYCAIALVPKQEAVLSRNVSVYVTFGMEIVMFVSLFAVIYILLKRQIVDNIRKINSSLSEITSGNLDVVVDVHNNEEFSSLSADINKTVDALKELIDEAAARIDQELEFARSIQNAALPSVFPLRSDFSVYALMDAAKEVGGDFYDFYLLDENTLGFLVADVSGKGIPAAMFMMQSKMLIQSLAETRLDPARVFTQANQKLCETNEAMMFITAWLGVLDLKTGKLVYANAGHNPPLLRHDGGAFEYIHSPAGFVLAGLEGIVYQKQEIQLSPGDQLYLYTDGVTEATNLSEELFGEDRLHAALGKVGGASAMEICKHVRREMDAFVGEAAQFDDITMLCLTYTGEEESAKELNLPAELKNLETVVSFVENRLAFYGCPFEMQTQVAIAVEEIFVNIANFAYEPDCGAAMIRVEVHEDPLEVIITFIDNGKPYDPLAKEDPNISLTADEDDLDRLGIFLVKKTMDDIQYEYSHGQNILRISKKL